MKRLQIIFGSAALLLAVSGAYITKANTTTVTRYVQHAESCDPIETDEPCNLVGTGCKEGTQQLFLNPSQEDPSICENPLKPNN